MSKDAEERAFRIRNWLNAPRSNAAAQAGRNLVNVLSRHILAHKPLIHVSSPEDDAFDWACVLVDRYLRPLDLWAELRAQNIADIEITPADIAASCSEVNRIAREHAQALLELLRSGYLPSDAIRVAGSAVECYTHPNGERASRVRERSLEQRLREFISQLGEPEPEPGKRARKSKGKGKARAESILAILELWLAVDGRPPRFQRDGSMGVACGPFKEFAEQVLDAVGIKGASLETLTREAESIFAGRQHPR